MKLEYSVKEPLNREPPMKDLVSSFITESGGYNRNHGPIPYIDGGKHVIKVDGAVENTLQLSISQLRTEFRQHEVVCALQCAGNRRHTMRTHKEVNGVDWGDGAVMNCKWKGPKLKDVLSKAALRVADIKKAHVAFASFQTLCQDDKWYGGSIDLARAMRDDREVILALDMNGKPLVAEHGYPVRIIAPGIIGARMVKWLDRITVQLEESTNFYQKLDYKILPPEATCKETAKKYWPITPALQELPVNSVVAVPEAGSTVELSPNGTIEIKGYALPQADQGPVVRVEVSVDDGRTWFDAQIIDGTRGRAKWSWVLWKTVIRMERGQKRCIFSRAIDKGGNTQPPHHPWNIRGLAYNGYGASEDLTIL